MPISFRRAFIWLILCVLLTYAPDIGRGFVAAEEVAGAEHDMAGVARRDLAQRLVGKEREAAADQHGRGANGSDGYGGKGATPVPEDVLDGKNQPLHWISPSTTA